MHGQNTIRARNDEWSTGAVLARGVNNLFLYNQEGYAAVFSGPLYTYPAVIVLAGLSIVIATTPYEDED